VTLVFRVVAGLFLLALAGGMGLWVLTAPRGLSAEAAARLPEGDAARGETWFWAGGCASCHAAEGAQGDDLLRLGGGLRLQTEFGTFVAPNVSTHPADGIGGWSAADFAAAMLTGTSPDGRHYYPSFPYGSYARMRPEDVADLWAFWQTLPAVEGRQPDHALAFPYSLRRGIGLWKRAFLDPSPVLPLDDGDPQRARGQYLVEGAGHCGECHTPRTWAGALDTGLWLAGAPNPSGRGRIPNITGGDEGIGGWSVGDLAYYFESGFTPDFDVVGGSMAAVQRNLAMLEAEDRDAIAAYLKAVPPLVAAD
jgi:mono/diheme cytochrome c family protein